MEQAVRARTAARSWATRTDNNVKILLGSEYNKFTLEEALKDLENRINKLDIAQTAVKNEIDISSLSWRKIFKRRTNSDRKYCLSGYKLVLHGIN
ncbi:Uncharacterised protein r2_g3219 [Pycnogonum litorale]